MIEERKELEKIENKFKTYRNEFGRDMRMWEAIAMQINSHTGNKQKFWNRVMDMFKEKYR
jgi:hypothetical protein